MLRRRHDGHGPPLTAARLMNNMSGVKLPAVRGTARLPLLSDLRRGFRTTKSIGEGL